MEIASPKPFATNPELVLKFHKQKGKQLLNLKTNKANIYLTKLEDYFEVTEVTQNVDDLDEKSRSTNILHLHGELLKVRNTVDAQLILDWAVDLVMGQVYSKGNQLRTHIVWFNETAPKLEKAITMITIADILVIIGTSTQVYPVVILINYVSKNTLIHLIDPKPAVNKDQFEDLIVIEKVVSIGTNKPIVLLQN